MRNLSLIGTSALKLPNANISATTWDLDENAFYLSSESDATDGEVEVIIWKTVDAGKSADVEQIAMFKTLASSNGPSHVQVISLRFIAELRKIVAIMRGGDVTTISVDDDATVEVEGSFECGISAASWNPDESSVAIVTGEQKLILLTSLFDVISEKPIHTDTFGEDAPINVGWGSKQTQFHGSLGKTAAQAQPTAKVGLSPDDDNLPRISWRGDGAFFVVSSQSPPTPDKPMKHRRLRVYDRQGVLQSTSEDVPGLEHDLVWRPSGNLIVGTQRFGFEGGGAGREGRHDIIFFERNGLRHGEFSLKVDEIGVKGSKKESGDRLWGYRIKELSWNSDSTVLAIWIEGDLGDIVQFWSTGNYHWYLKHEVSAPSDASGEPGRFTSLLWHPEKALSVSLTTRNRILTRAYAWDTWASHSQPPNDSGTVAVLDGSSLLLTPFRSQNVPPPMSSCQLSLRPDTSPATSPSYVNVPLYASFAVERDVVAILWEDGRAEIWNLNTRLHPGPGKVMNPVKVWSGFLQHSGWRQLALEAIVQSNSFRLTALGSLDGTRDTVTIMDINGPETKSTSEFSLPFYGCRLLSGKFEESYQSPDGSIFKYEEGEGIPTPLARFPDFCLHAYKVSPTAQQDSKDLYVGLGKTGKVYISRSDEETRILASNANSSTIASGFIIFTTTAHEAVFAPIATISRVFDSEEMALKETPSDWQTRKVERGSRIVVPLPSTMALVLQMPRGNLETINPRPLVMEVVNQEVDAGNYRKAFFACRKHRIDLNAIVDRDQARFLEHIPQFIEQVHEVDHLDLFITMVGRGSQSPELVAQLCDAFRTELERKDLIKYVNTILTTHVVKTPPDHEAGLAVIQKLRDLDEKIVEDAVKYIIFLVDANSLFDTALGMYDFSLVTMVAQHAQKDPREYLPFLRELRALETYYQRFKIDDYLKRHSKALKQLSLAGEERFEEAVLYMEQHRLYEDGMTIWKDTEHYADILDSYGDWLFERREFRQAASVFYKANRMTKAMIAYEKDLDWQELFELAIQEKVSDEDVVAMAYRVAEDLTSKKRHAEAGRVLLDYANDTREAVIAFVEGNHFSEARRVISLSGLPELVEDIVYPASLESRSKIAEDIGEMREQIRKQRNRLRELRVKKEEEPDAFYGTEDNTALHNVDVMTDVSMPATAFTRYTAAPTTASRASRRTSRSKRKMERKIGSGKKGTADEEEYLLRSVTKLADRFKVTQGEAKNLLPHLYRLTDVHREEGREMQEEVAAFEKELMESVEEIWQPRPILGEDGVEHADGWAARMAEIDRNARVDALQKVSKPDIGFHQDWRLKLYESSS